MRDLDVAGPAERRALGQLRVGPRWALASAAVVALVVALALFSGLANGSAVRATFPPGASGGVPFGGRGGPPGAVFPGGAPASFIDLNVVAGVLHMTTAELQVELASGAPLAEIISQHGATVDQVVSALVDQARSQLDVQVAAGQLSPAQEQQLLASSRRRLQAAIESNRVGP